MKIPLFCEAWPESWKQSYAYDREEVWGEISVLGYAYAYENRAEKTLKAVFETAKRIENIGCRGGPRKLLASTSGTWISRDME